MDPPRRRRADGKPGKQDLLIALAGQRHDLHRLPLNRVARIAGEIGAEVNLHQGTARRVLKAHVQALQQQAASHTATEARP
jgi:histone H3/H4